MQVFSKINRVMYDPAYYLGKYAVKHFRPELIPDILWIKYEYHYVFGKKLSLTNPKTFNEKLQWLKLFDRKPQYSVIVDKYAVKEWIQNCLPNGAKYIIPTIAIYDSIDEIDINQLPDKFVIKCTHDSGSTFICTNKATFDINTVKSRLITYLSTNHYIHHREWPYKNVPRRIIVEQFIGNNLQDYRIYCFNGIPQIIYSYYNKSNNDGSKPETEFCDIMDINWNILPFRQNSPAKGKIPKPELLPKMLELSKLLSNNFPFLRVDFYSVSGKLYVGELTLFPGGGLSKFVPQIYDQKLGELLDLSKTKRSH